MLQRGYLRMAFQQLNHALANRYIAPKFQPSAFSDDFSLRHRVRELVTETELFDPEVQSVSVAIPQAQSNHRLPFLLCRCSQPW
jgi:hypothetical protein